MDNKPNLIKRILQKCFLPTDPAVGDAVPYQNIYWCLLTTLSSSSIAHDHNVSSVAERRSRVENWDQTLEFLWGEHKKDTRTRCVEDCSHHITHNVIIWRSPSREGQLQLKEAGWKQDEGWISEVSGRMNNFLARTVVSIRQDPMVNSILIDLTRWLGNMPELYQCTLPLEARLYAAQVLNEDENQRDEIIRRIKQWLETQPALRARSDVMNVLRFLRGCKFNEEKTKNKLVNYYTMRSQLPEWFGNRDPELPQLVELLDMGVKHISGGSATETRNCRRWWNYWTWGTRNYWTWGESQCQTYLWWFGNRDQELPQLVELLDMGVFLPLRHHDYEGHLVVIVRTAVHNPQVHRQNDVFKIGKMIVDLCMEEDEMFSVYGVVALFDLTGVSLGHAKQLPPSVIRKAVHAWQNCFPVRIRKMEFFNAPVHVNVVLNIFKRFMTDKLRQRVHIHSKGLESLQDVIKPELLPQEYGGSDGTLKQLIDTVRLVLIQRLSTGPSGVDEPREVCLFQSTGKNVSWTSGNGSWRKRNTRLTLVDQCLAELYETIQVSSRDGPRTPLIGTFERSCVAVEHWTRLSVFTCQVWLRRHKHTSVLPNIDSNDQGPSRQQELTIPGPFKEQEITIPGPFKEQEITIPGPSRQQEITIPGPSRQQEITIPGPSRQQEITIPGPFKEQEITIPGPSRKQELTIPRAGRLGSSLRRGGARAPHPHESPVPFKLLYDKRYKLMAGLAARNCVVSSWLWEHQTTGSRVVRLGTDNTTVLHSAVKGRGLVFAARDMCDLHLLVAHTLRECWWDAYWLASEINPADRPSREEMERVILRGLKPGCPLVGRRVPPGPSPVGTVAAILVAKYGTLGELEPQYGTLGELEQQYGTLGELEQQYGTLGELEQQYGTLGELEQQYGTLGELEPQYRTL
uniref:CRAL-TRIO domain-containing protein n=1 Tax=Timema shepardi TaxID=629360 RepID=A0A7R9G5K8_TIMSH|nr:unnamed protein product [Timema shepardi]